jgi:hypothetical protein
MVVRHIFRLSYVIGALFMLSALAKLLPVEMTMAVYNSISKSKGYGVF